MISVILSLLAGGATQPAATITSSPVIMTPTPRGAPPIIVAPAPPPVSLQSLPPEGDFPHRASANLPALFATDDYPFEARRKGETGTVAFTAAIDRDGRVTDCTITTSSGSPSLDLATCSIIRSRARFRPARDAAGRAVEDSQSARISWRLPPVEVTPYADKKAAIIFTTGPAGEITNCRTEGGVPSPADVCGAMMSLTRKIIVAGRGRFSFNSRDIVFEDGLLVGGPESARSVGPAEGGSLIMLVAVAIDIDDTGSVTRCLAADGNTDGRLANKLCEESNWAKFVPLEAGAHDRSDRRAVRYRAGYTRPTS